MIDTDQADRLVLGSTGHDSGHDSSDRRCARPVIPIQALFEDVAEASAAPPGPHVVPPLDEYERIIVFFSGGKDSVACVLDLLERGVPRDRIELHHHLVDGAEGSDLMDWPCTLGYCEAFAQALGLTLTTSWKVHGFEGEMLRQDAPTQPYNVPGIDGARLVIGGERSKPNTRMRFPQVSPDLRVRWCSASVKISAADRYFNTHPRFQTGQKFLAITGERAQESRARANYQTFEPHRCDNRRGKRVDRWIDHWRPVHHWDEVDVWRALERWSIQCHPAYEIGLGRASCQACIFSGPDQWATMAYMAPARFARIAAYEQSFGVTIHRSLSVTELASRGKVLPGAFTRWREIALAPVFSEPIFCHPWRLPPGAFGDSSGPS